MERLGRELRGMVGTERGVWQGGTSSLSASLGGVVFRGGWAINDHIELTRQNGWAGTPVIFARSTELPRGALVEYQVNVHSGRQGYEGAAQPVDGDDDDDEEDENELTGVYAKGDVRGAYWETCQAPRKRQGARAAIFLPGGYTWQIHRLITDPLRHGRSARAHRRPSDRRRPVARNDHPRIPPRQRAAFSW